MYIYISPEFWSFPFNVSCLDLRGFQDWWICDQATSGGLDWPTLKWQMQSIAGPNLSNIFPQTIKKTYFFQIRVAHKVTWIAWKKNNDNTHKLDSIYLKFGTPIVFQGNGCVHSPTRPAIPKLPLVFRWSNPWQVGIRVWKVWRLKRIRTCHLVKLWSPEFASRLYFGGLERVGSKLWSQY